MKGEVERLQERIDEHVAKCDERIAEYEAEIDRLRAVMVDQMDTDAAATKAAYADMARLRAAIEAHRERWTSVNSGDIRMNARPADLELWDVLDTPTGVEG